MKNPTKFHSTSLWFGPSMVGLFYQSCNLILSLVGRTALVAVFCLKDTPFQNDTAKLQLFHEPAREWNKKTSVPQEFGSCSIMEHLNIGQYYFRPFGAG